MGLVDMFAQDASHRMKIKVDTDVLGFMGTGAVAANKGAAAGAISGSVNLGAVTLGSADNSVSVDYTNAVTKLVDIGLVLDEQNIPPEGRFVVLPSWYTALLKLGDLRRADITGDSTGAVRTGLIGQVDNLSIYQSNNLNVFNTNVGGVGAGANVTRIVAGSKEATTFAAQIAKVDELQIQNSFGVYWRSLMVYGRAIVQNTALVNMLAKKA